MAPNLLSETNKPICVSDSFHFSSFYWRESNASLAGLNNGNDSDDSDDTNTGRKERGISMDSETDSAMGDGESALFKVRACLSFHVAHSITICFANSHIFYHLCNTAADRRQPRPRQTQVLLQGPRRQFDLHPLRQMGRFGYRTARCVRPCQRGHDGLYVQDIDGTVAPSGGEFGL